MRFYTGTVFLLAISTISSAKSGDDEFAKNRTATFRSGLWTAEAADWKGYTFSPRLSCRISTGGAKLEQARPAESGEMWAGWSFFEKERRGADNFEIKWIKIDRARYEYVSLPWRLPSPTDDGIILTFGISLQAIRLDHTHQWLPVSYLTLPLLNARSMQVGYQYERDDRIFEATRTFSLSGFKEAAKWCGRQLLPDLSDTRFQEILK